MNWEDIQGLVRHTLTTAGGALVTHGYLSADDLNTAVGALCVLLGVVWSMVNKYQHRKAQGAK